MKVPPSNSQPLPGSPSAEPDTPQFARIALQQAVASQWDSLLKNPSDENFLSLIQHWHLWSPEQKAELRAQNFDMSGAIRVAVCDSDMQIKNNAFAAISDLQAVVLLPDLVKLSMQPNYLHRSTSSAVLLELTDKLYRANQEKATVKSENTIPPALQTELVSEQEVSASAPECADGVPPGPVFKWPTQVSRLRSLLETSLQHYKLGGRSEVLLVQLTFSDQDDTWIERILADKSHSAHEDLLGLFENSSLEPVLHKLAGYLTIPRPLPCITSLWRRRRDIPFLRIFFQTIARVKTAEVTGNLRRLSQPFWLNEVLSDITVFSIAEQLALLELVKNCLPQDDQVLDALSRILPQSRIVLRRQIVFMICQLTGVRANQLIAELLDSETDAQIIMQLIPELRRRNLARAMKKLLSLLDHGHSGVRKKAAEAFHNCTIQRYLAAFDLLEEPVRRSTGQLVFKVDPATNRVLADELSCGNRVRQVRALHAISSIGNIDDILGLVMKLAQNPDPRLKIAAIGTLADSTQPEAKGLIRRYLVDEDPSVRKAAELSLDVANEPFDEKTLLDE